MAWKPSWLKSTWAASTRSFLRLGRGMRDFLFSFGGI